METDHKQRGFMRNKLAKTFSRVTKRGWPVQHGSCKVRPTQLPNRNGSVSYFTLQDLSNPPSMQKAVCLREQSGFYDYYGPADENVDTEAAKYILSVKARFNQERDSTAV